MKISLTQTELCVAVEHYLNTVLLKDKVTVSDIKREKDVTANSVLHVIVNTKAELKT